MRYRPEYALDVVRRSVADSDSTPRLPWLRSLVIDLTWTPRSLQDRCIEDRLLEQPSDHCVIEAIVVREGSVDLSGRLRVLLNRSGLRLAVLDLRSCEHCDSTTIHQLLDHTALTQATSLRRLLLPQYSTVPQAGTLDRFVELETLDVSGCQHFTNVDFCSATLRELYASGCRNLSDRGLLHATKLEILHVAECARVTTLQPFAHSLLQLDASVYCGIDEIALSYCTRLQVLHMSLNNKIKSITEPLACRLRELDASLSCLDDAALSGVTGLIRFDASHNESITTVAPFGRSLRVLNATASSIDDDGLHTATRLVSLNASHNQGIGSVEPFASTLLTLSLHGNQTLNDCAIAAAAGLFELQVSEVEDDALGVTTVLPFAVSLRHLEAQHRCKLGDVGLQKARHLVTLDCSGNSRITTIEPFAATLEILHAQYRTCRLQGETIARALRRDANITNKNVVVAPLKSCLRMVTAYLNERIAVEEHLIPYGFVILDTLTYVRP